MASEDFDGDGNPDLALADYSVDTVSVLLGDGNGGFGAKTDFATGDAPRSVTSADFDADGNPDLAAANYGVNTVSVLLGDGSGGFGTKTDFGTGDGPISVTSDDFDGDGNPDLAAASYFSDTVSVLLNSGTPTTYPTERRLSFGRKSAPRTRSLTIRNGGAAKLHAGTASITGADASAYQIASDHCSGQTIAVHQGCEVTIRFQGSSESFKRASLVLPSNASDTPLKVPLTGYWVDQPPTAVDDSETVAQDSGPTTIDVLANDADPYGGPMTIQSKTSGAHGQVAITNSGADLTYTPDAGYCGPDSFTYSLNGGSTATVSITVTCAAKPPTGPDATATAPAKQAIHGKKVEIAVDLAADADVHVVVSGKCEPEGSRKSLALKRQDVDLKAGETLTLKLIPKKNPGLIHRALNRGRKVTAQVKIRFYGADGSVKLQKLRVRLK
ncbi:MAG: FG-GAP-like repeat-containing protein [Solirubrobacterales bacterium]